MSYIKLKSEYIDLDKYRDYFDNIFYYKKGTSIYHNPYGPAYIIENVYKAYLIEGQWHRLDGPARIWINCKEEYCINGYSLTKEEFEIHPERLKYLKKEHLICLM